MDKPGVLFLCVANSARSVMAEAFCRREAGGRLEVLSAGLQPRPVHLLTVRVMREVGIDVADHVSRSVDEFLGKRSFRYTVTVCQAAESDCPFMWPFSVQHLSWPFDNPAAEDGSADEQLCRFRKARDEIEAKVVEWVRELPAEL